MTTQKSGAYIPRSGGPVNGPLTVQDVLPGANLTYQLGSTGTGYYLRAAIRRIYVNDTAFIDGATGGRVSVSGQIRMDDAGVVSGSSDYDASFFTVTSSGSYSGAMAALTVRPIGAVNQTWVLGVKSNPRSNGSAVVGKLASLTAIPEHISSGLVTDIIGVEVQPYISSTGNATNLYMFKGQNKSGSGAGSILNAFGLHLNDITYGTVSNRAIKTGLGLVEFGDTVFPTNTNTKDLGQSAKYWANVYGTKHYFNSTAILDGSVAGQIGVTGTLNLSTPLPIASGGTGSATQNFVDLTTTQTVDGVKTFTSSPIVPTPTTSTQAANKSYVDSAVTAGSPDATTTSKGIIRLAGDLSGTALSPTVPGLANKADLASPTFTGTPTAPTPTQGDNSTKLATTAYVDAAAAAVEGSDVDTFNGRSGTVVPANGDYTASQVTNVPAGNIAATTVQAALNELDVEKQATGNYITDLTGDVTASGPGSAAATVNFANDTIHLLKTGGTITGAVTLNSTLTMVNASGSTPVLQLNTSGNASTDTQFLSFVGSRMRVGYDNNVLRIDDGGSSKTMQISLTSFVTNFTGNGVLFGGTQSPTHPITLPSSSTGMAFHNQTDQTTNYERAVFAWSSNTFLIQTQQGGTGSSRAISIANGNAGITINQNATTNRLAYNASSFNTAGPGHTFSASLTGASTNQTFFAVTPTWNQTGTSAGTDLLINRTQTAVGSGSQLLIDMQVAGSSKAKVDTNGIATFANVVKSVVSPTTTGNVATTTSTELVNATGGAVTRTLYTPVGNAGAEVYLQKTDSSANTVTIATAAGTIIGGITSLGTQFKRVRYISNGTDWYVKENN